MRHAAHVAPGGRWTPPIGRYNTLFTLAKPRSNCPPRTFFLVDIMDAYADPAKAPTTFDAQWARAAAAGGWIIEPRLPGWGGDVNTKVAVDLSKREPWAWLTAYARGYKPVGLQNIYWDDVSVNPILDGVAQRVNRTAWWENALAFMAGPGMRCDDAINGGKFWLVPEGSCSCRTIKLEGPHSNHPWGARPGHDLTWNSWVFGDPDHGPGIKRMTRAGKTVIWEGYVPESWIQLQKEAYARVLVATLMLFDNTELMIHREGGDWWRNPQWYDCCAWPDELGRPLLRAGQWPDGSWRRQYERGMVVVDAGGASARVE